MQEIVIISIFKTTVIIYYYKLNEIRRSFRKKGKSSTVSRWHLFLTNLHYNYVSVVCEFYSFMDLEHCSKH